MHRKILILEPYYGGSHKLFLDGLSSNIKADYTFLTLPARKWKMRMQLSALWFVQQIQELPLEKRKFDLVICSTFVDLALLRSLLSMNSWWNQKTPMVVYFHENQFSYPGQIADPQINQFTSINFTTALSADSLAFNSNYNFNCFIKGINRYLKKATDMTFSTVVESIKQKSRVIHPGLDFSLIDATRVKKQTGRREPVIVWNHRWEHDKDPDHFFSSLYQLHDKGIKFKLIVLGQSFRNKPLCFSQAQKRLAEHIIHFGYVESKQKYSNLLSQSDIVVSTARHEFFGISIIEAVRSGCYPLLPNRLSYPELFGDQYLYKEKQLGKCLTQIIKDSRRIDSKTAMKLTNHFQWSSLKKEYKKWLFADTISLAKEPSKRDNDA